MTAIQAIFVRGWEERNEPKPHTVFRIEIQASVRSWQMWRRYSEFVDLHTELTKSTGSSPPCPLPPKHAVTMTMPLFRSRAKEEILEERRAGLEQYLRAILSSKEDKWRETFAFRDFLGVPVGKQGGVEGGVPTTFTSSSWLDEHQDLQSRVRDIRADINKRDALSDRGEVSEAHQANVQAKKKLAAVMTRVGTLENGLRDLGLSGMIEGELQRRRDMAARLRDDCEKLAKMVTVARLTSRGLGSAAERNPASESDRAALLDAPSSSAFGRPSGRAFGSAAQPRETEETRPLDDHGILQLQQDKMALQDQTLSQLSTILQRQKQLGLAINQEVQEHIEMLEELDNEVDRVGGKLTGANRQLRRLG
ncbi:syntaxin [Panus rudis PR-1116 ss-1]|nr:syntaxin [Panus rudis PR-1116 ss-1]